METSLIQRQARGPQAVLTELLLPAIGPRMSATSFPLSDAVAVSSTSLGPDLANIYLHARYYDPVLGIFLSPDPAGADSNTYRYAGGDPVNFADPSGLERGPAGGREGGEACQRFGWSCSWNEYSGGDPTSLGVASVDAGGRYGGLPGVISLPGGGFALPSANPIRSAIEMGGGVAYDPNTGVGVYVQPNSGGNVASSGLYNTAQFAAGFGNSVSFGLTGLINGIVGNDDVINTGSGYYTAGTATGFVVTAVTGATVAKVGSVVVGSGSGGATSAAQVVRILPKGTKLADVVNDAKALTWSTGNEHALVKLANGQRALVSGGPGGISFAPGQISRLFGHTHPYGTSTIGASAADRAALGTLNQMSSWIVQGGRIYKFGRN